MYGTVWYLITHSKSPHSHGKCQELWMLEAPHTNVYALKRYGRTTKVHALQETNASQMPLMASKKTVLQQKV